MRDEIKDIIQRHNPETAKQFDIIDNDPMKSNEGMPHNYIGVKHSVDNMKPESRELFRKMLIDSGWTE
jgi:hypothetical protein